MTTFDIDDYRTVWMFFYSQAILEPRRVRRAPVDFAIAEDRDYGCRPRRERRRLVDEAIAVLIRMTRGQIEAEMHRLGSLHPEAVPTLAAAVEKYCERERGRRARAA